MSKVRFGKYEVEISRDVYAESPREWDNVSTMYCSHKRYSLGDSQEMVDEVLYEIARVSKVDKFNEIVKEMLKPEFRQKEDYLQVYVNGVVVDDVDEESEFYYSVTEQLDMYFNYTEMFEILSKLVPVFRKLYLYDHSVLSISGSSFIGRAQHAEWDSGVVGFAIITDETLEKEGITVEKGEELIDAEIRDYNTYLQGEIYTITVSEVSRCECCGREEVEVIDSCGNFYQHNGDMVKDMLDGFRFEDVEGIDIVKIVEGAI